MGRAKPAQGAPCGTQTPCDPHVLSKSAQEGQENPRNSTRGQGDCSVWPAEMLALTELSP